MNEVIAPLAAAKCTGDPKINPSVFIAYLEDPVNTVVKHVATVFGTCHAGGTAGKWF
jgi:hypothetical protein